MLIVIILISLAPLAAFWPTIDTVDEFAWRVALFGLFVAIEAFIGHTFSLPHLHGEDRQWGALTPDAWGKLVRWCAALTAVIGLAISVFLVPALTR
ncbi:hypothetical protein ACLBWJ_11295 [Microbacterium sp. M4A5_1d]